MYSVVSWGRAESLPSRNYPEALLLPLTGRPCCDPASERSRKRGWRDRGFVGLISLGKSNDAGAVFPGNSRRDECRNAATGMKRRDDCFKGIGFCFEGLFHFG